MKFQSFFYGLDAHLHTWTYVRTYVCMYVHVTKGEIVWSYHILLHHVLTVVGYGSLSGYGPIWEQMC